MNQIIVKKFVIAYSRVFIKRYDTKISLNCSAIDQTITSILCAVNAIEKYQVKRGGIKLRSL